MLIDNFSVRDLFCNECASNLPVGTLRYHGPFLVGCFFSSSLPLPAWSVPRNTEIDLAEYEICESCFKRGKHVKQSLKDEDLFKEIGPT